MFGDHDRRMLLRRAAKAAGIDEHRVGARARRSRAR
jgi:hypothetical protein